MVANDVIACPNNPAFPNAETSIHSLCPLEMAGLERLVEAAAAMPATLSVFKTLLRLIFFIVIFSSYMIII